MSPKQGQLLRSGIFLAVGEFSEVQSAAQLLRNQKWIIGFESLTLSLFLSLCASSSLCVSLSHF